MLRQIAKAIVAQVERSQRVLIADEVGNSHESVPAQIDFNQIIEPVDFSQGCRRECRKLEVVQSEAMGATSGSDAPKGLTLVSRKWGFGVIAQCWRLRHLSATSGEVWLDVTIIVTSAGRRDDEQHTPADSRRRMATTSLEPSRRHAPEPADHDVGDPLPIQRCAHPSPLLSPTSLRFQQMTIEKTLVGSGRSHLPVDR